MTLRKWLVLSQKCILLLLFFLFFLLFLRDSVPPIFGSLLIDWGSPNLVHSVLPTSSRPVFRVFFNFQFLGGFSDFLKKHLVFHSEAYKVHHISATIRSTVSKFGMPLPNGIIYAFISWIFFNFQFLGGFSGFLKKHLVFSQRALQGTWFLGNYKAYGFQIWYAPSLWYDLWL